MLFQYTKRTFQFVAMESLKLYEMVSGLLSPEENCPLVRVGVCVKARVSFRVREQPNNCHEDKLAPRYS